MIQNIISAFPERENLTCIIINIGILLVQDLGEKERLLQDGKTKKV